MIRDRRNTLSVYRKASGGTGKADTISLIRTFLGRIDKGSSDTGFEDGKLTNTTNPVLFCAITESFTSKDLIQDIDGQRYVIAAGTQPDGVSGIAPITYKAHKEIRLEKANS